MVFAIATGEEQAVEAVEEEVIAAQYIHVQTPWLEDVCLKEATPKPQRLQRIQG